MLLGDFDVNVKDALESFKKLNESFNHTITSFAKFGAMAGGGFAAFEGIETIMHGFEGVIGLSEHLNALHNVTGDSVHDLEIFEHTLRLAGGSAEMSEGFIQKLNMAVSGVNEEGKNTAAAFRDLSLSQTDLANKGLLDRMQMLSAAFGKIKSDTDKAAIAGDLFGKRQGAEALKVLSNPEAMQLAAKQAGPLANVLDKNAAKFEDLSHAIEGVKLDLTEFFAGALEGLAGDATDTANAIASIDWVELGRSVGVCLDAFTKMAALVVNEVVPAMNKIAEFAKGEKHKTDALGGAAIGAAIGTVIAGPLGTAVGAVFGYAVGHYFGHDDKKTPGGEHPLAAAVKAVSAPLPWMGGPVGHLQKIGLGGNFSLASHANSPAQNPLLTEAQTTNRHLQTISTTLSQRNPSSSNGSFEPVPV